MATLPLLSVTQEGTGGVEINNATLQTLLSSPFPHYTLSFFHKAPLAHDVLHYVASTVGCTLGNLPDFNGIRAHIIPLANVRHNGTLVLLECRILDKPTNTPLTDSLLCACAAYLANAGIVLNVAQGMDNTALRCVGTAMAHAAVREVPLLCVFAHNADTFYDPATYWDPRTTIEAFLENSNKDGVNETRLKEYVRTCVTNRFLFPIPDKVRGESPNLAPLHSGVEFMLHRCLELVTEPPKYASLSQFINSVNIGGVLEAAARWQNKKQCLHLANMAVARFTSELYQIYDGEIFEVQTSQNNEGISVDRFLAMHTDAANHAREWFEEHLPFTDGTSRREAVERLNQGFETSLRLFIHFLYRDNDRWFETLRELADSIQELNENFQEYKFIVLQAKYAMTVLEGQVHAVHQYAQQMCNDAEMIRAEGRQAMSEAKEVIRQLEKSARLSIFQVICCVTSVIAGGIGLVNALAALSTANGFMASVSAVGNVFASTGTILQGLGEDKISRHLFAASGLAGALSMANVFAGGSTLAFADIAQAMRGAGTFAGALGHTGAARALTGIGALADLGNAFTQPSNTVLQANNITYVLRSAGTLADVSGNLQLGGMLKALAGIGELATDSFEFSFSTMASVTQVAGNIGIATNSEFAEPLMLLSMSFSNVAGIVDFLKPKLRVGAEEPSQLEIEEDVREILETNFSVKGDIREEDLEKLLEISEDAMEEQVSEWYEAKTPATKKQQASSNPDKPQSTSTSKPASTSNSSSSSQTPSPSSSSSSSSSIPSLAASIVLASVAAANAANASVPNTQNATQNTQSVQREQKKKEEPSNWAIYGSAVMDLVPILSSVKGASQAWTGQEWFTNDEVHRGVELLGIIPAAKIGKYAWKGTKKVGQYVMKKFGWVGKAVSNGSVDAKVVQKVVDVEKQRVTKNYVQKMESSINTTFKDNPAAKTNALSNLQKADKDFLLKESSQGYNNLLQVEKLLNQAKDTKYINSSRVLQRSAKEPGPYHNFPESFTQEVLKTGTKKEAPGYFRMEKKGYSKDSAKYTKEGSVNGVDGEFQVYTRKSEKGGVELIMHKFFEPKK